MSDKNDVKVPFLKVKRLQYVYKSVEDKEYFIITLEDDRKVCICDSDLEISKSFAKKYNREVK